MNVINFHGDEETETCVVSGNREGLETIIEMIESKLKLKNHTHETLICKDYRGNDCKIRFELIEEQSNETY